MTSKLKASVFAACFLWTVSATPQLFAADHSSPSGKQISHVLLISIDGMHALDFSNCSKGISTINGGQPYCPNMAALGQTGISYIAASTSKPSDSFPGLTSLITGATPRSAGLFYDISYDRALSPPAQTTPYGIVGGPTLCPSVVGTQVGFDEQIDVDLTRVDGGGGINPDYLPRDPNKGCAKVYPHSYLRVNTIFNVVKEAGGYTAWTDKHPAYEFTNGPNGNGVDDFFGPEINSTVVPLDMKGYDVPSCHTIPDTTSTSDWTTSFQNIQCYDSLHVQAILNQIDGKTHDGSSAAPVPTVFGANFQSVSVGQKLVESSISTTGGYVDALGTPSPALLTEIQFMDNAIGQFVAELKKRELYASTLIIITAKHGQSAIDPNRLLRIPADNPAFEAPSDALGGIGGPIVAQAIEDDVSLMWLNNSSLTSSAVLTLTQNEGVTGGGEIFAGNSLNLLFNDPTLDSRSPDIVQAPNVGVIYTGHQAKVAEHGGFAHDDTNVMMLLSNPKFAAQTVTGSVETRQVAPTILRALGLQPSLLTAVQQEHTTILPELPFVFDHQ
jgi:type I phosphodiesterase/nucleotide pyrophosphatase